VPAQLLIPGATRQISRSSAYASISRRSAPRSRRKIAAIQVVSMEGSPQRLYGRYSSGNRSFSAPSFGRSLNTMYG